MARSKQLQSEAGYIDARPLTANSTKSSCNARPDHTSGSNSEVYVDMADFRFSFRSRHRDVRSACPKSATPHRLARRAPALVRSPSTRTLVQASPACVPRSGQTSTPALCRLLRSRGQRPRRRRAAKKRDEFAPPHVRSQTQVRYRSGLVGHIDRGRNQLRDVPPMG